MSSFRTSGVPGRLQKFTEQWRLVLASGWSLWLGDTFHGDGTSYPGTVLHTNAVGHKPATRGQYPGYMSNPFWNGLRKCAVTSSIRIVFSRLHEISRRKNESRLDHSARLGQTGWVVFAYFVFAAWTEAAANQWEPSSVWALLRHAATRRHSQWLVSIQKVNSRLLVNASL